MKRKANGLIFIAIVFLMSSCVTQKKYESLQTSTKACNDELQTVSVERNALKGQVDVLNNSLVLKQEQIDDLKSQINDLKIYRDKQLEQVGDLTVLSQTANNNIKESLAQLEKKDNYITLLQNARTKADSINLALAINLKSVLKDGIDDRDIEINVDKTVVFINLSDKMLFESGSSDLTDRANEVLAKIAAIALSRPDVDVMVEGYTDNVPIQSNCLTDNWDLSAKRATAVVRILQTTYGVDPNKLIAAGRGEYNTLATNDTEEGRATNRRTRIILMPKLNQFYDLLSPTNIPK